MNGDGIGKLQFFQLLVAIFHQTAFVKLYGNQLRKVVDLPYDTRITIVDSGAFVYGNSVFVANFPLDIIVIFNLHDFITHPVDDAIGFLLEFVL